MTTRHTLQILAVVASVALTVTPVLAGDNEKGGTEAFGVCFLDGAWLGSIDYGFYVLGWTAVYDSDTYWTGPISVEFIGLDPSFFGYTPDASAYSTTAGSWVRTGRRTFEYTMITYLLDAANPSTGQALPVYIGKNTGTIEFSGRCDTMTVQSLSTEVFAPDQNPFGGEPLFCLPDGSAGDAHRITVDPPCASAW